MREIQQQRGRHGRYVDLSSTRPRGKRFLQRAEGVAVRLAARAPICTGRTAAAAKMPASCEPCGVTGAACCDGGSCLSTADVCNDANVCSSRDLPLNCRFGAACTSTQEGRCTAEKSGLTCVGGIWSCKRGRSCDVGKVCVGDDDPPRELLPAPPAPAPEPGPASASCKAVSGWEELIRNCGAPDKTNTAFCYRPGSTSGKNIQCGSNPKNAAECQRPWQFCTVNG